MDTSSRLQDASPVPLTRSWGALARLIRLPSQSGTWLLLWPSWWSLWFACRGVPPLRLLLIFFAGAFLMRSAGVIMNDLADREIDRQVTRTRSRPLAAGELSIAQAVATLALLLGAAAWLLTWLPPFTWALSPVAVLLAAGYPLAKRILAIPQAILGIAFGWGVIMAWASVHERVDAPAWAIFFGTICWAVAYDTIYAMQDQEDDRRIGVHSSALFFGKRAWLAILLAEGGMVFSLALAAWLTDSGPWFYLILALVSAFFIRQALLVRTTPTRAEAFRFFRQHVWVGAVLLAGIALGFA